MAAARTVAGIHPHQALRSGGDGVVVRGDFRHPRAECARRRGADGQDIGVAGYSPRCRCWTRSFARCRCWCHLLLSWLVFGWMIARLPREPVNYRQLDSGRFARGGRLRAVQVGRLDLSEVRAAQPGGRHIRTGAGPDGVRLHHRAAAAVRDRVGGDVDGKPAPAAPVEPPEPAVITTQGATERGSQRATDIGRCGSGRRWGTWPFPTSPA